MDSQPPSSKSLKRKLSAAETAAALNGRTSSCRRPARSEGSRATWHSQFHCRATERSYLCCSLQTDLLPRKQRCHLSQMRPARCPPLQNHLTRPRSRPPRARRPRFPACPPGPGQTASNASTAAAANSETTWTWCHLSGSPLGLLPVGNSDPAQQSALMFSQCPTW